jgi:hypothetical protein
MPTASGSVSAACSAAGAGFQPALRGRSVIEKLAAEFVAEYDVSGEVHRFAAGKMPG